MAALTMREASGVDPHPLGITGDCYPLAIEIARSTSEQCRVAIRESLANVSFIGEVSTEAPGWMHPTSGESELIAELHITNLPLWPRKPGLAVMAGGWSVGVFDQTMITGFLRPATGEQDQITNPAVNSRTVVLPPNPEMDQVVRAVMDWLSEYAPDRPTDADRLRHIRNRVEQLIRELHLRILENAALCERLEEGEVLIEQLRAQVSHLEAELRRKKISPQRVGLPVALIKYLIGPAAIAAIGGYVGVQAASPAEAPPPHVVVVDDSAEQLRVVQSVCNQVLLELERSQGG